MKCARCGKLLKNYYPYSGKFYGIECVKKVGGDPEKIKPIAIGRGDPDVNQLKLFGFQYEAEKSRE